jgi:hypothetical protein
MSILNVTYLHQPFHAEPIQVLYYELANSNDTFTISGPIYHGAELNLISSLKLMCSLLASNHIKNNLYIENIGRNGNHQVLVEI